MNEDNVSPQTEDTRAFLADFTKFVEKAKYKPDKAFEIFKTIAPDLWERYKDVPLPEFEDALKSAAKFSKMAAVEFSRHARATKGGDSTPESRDKE